MSHHAGAATVERRPASRSDRFNRGMQPHEITAITASENWTLRFVSADIFVVVRNALHAPGATEIEVKVERESGLCAATCGLAASCRFTQI